MEIIKFKKKNNNIYTVYLNDKTTINLYDDTIIKFNLLGNKKLDKQKFQSIIDYNNTLESYHQALKYISIKLRTKKEITKYLTRKNFSAATIKTTIARLEKEKYLNDDVYLTAYINDQVNLTSKGPDLIEKELEKAGFTEAKIRPYLAKINDEVWLAKINKIILKKVKANHNLSARMLKEKIKQFLRKEGYFLDQINRVVDNFTFKENAEILEKEFNKELAKLKKKYNEEELKIKIKYNLYRKGFDMSKIDNLLETVDNGQK